VFLSRYVNLRSSYNLGASLLNTSHNLWCKHGCECETWWRGVGFHWRTGSTS